MPMGLKIVRGAYLVEENGLAEKYGYCSPVCDNAEETAINIFDNI